MKISELTLPTNERVIMSKITFQEPAWILMKLFGDLAERHSRDMDGIRRLSGQEVRFPAMPVTVEKAADILRPVPTRSRHKLPQSRAEVHWYVQYMLVGLSGRELIVGTEDVVWAARFESETGPRGQRLFYFKTRCLFQSGGNSDDNRNDDDDDDDF